MSKQEQESKTADSAGTEPRFVLQRTYIKDARFHAPRSTDFFQPQNVPLEIKLNLNSEPRKLADGFYEVTLKLSVTALDQKAQATIYEVAVSQAGLFSIGSFPEPDFGYIINVSCPSMLYPYARQAMLGMVGHAGFPSLSLAPINFGVLHQQYLERLQKTNQAPAEPKH